MNTPYAGKHTINVLVIELPYPFEGRDERISVRITCETHNAIVLDQHIEKIRYPFYGARGDGFALLRYSVPEDLPLDDTVECTLEADSKTQQFFSANRAFAVSASKQSEE